MNIVLSQAAWTSLLAIAISNPGVSSVPPQSIVQATIPQDSILLIATAYTDQTLPTLH